ncbi:MAG: hypothetical protein R6X27_12120 [Candidatus Desulfacyla sp.]
MKGPFTPLSTAKGQWTDERRDPQHADLAKIRSGAMAGETDIRNIQKNAGYQKPP